MNGSLAMAGEGTATQLYYRFGGAKGTIYDTDCGVHAKRVYQNCRNPNPEISFTEAPYGSGKRCNWVARPGCYYSWDNGYSDALPSCGDDQTLPDGSCRGPVPEYNIGACDECENISNDRTSVSVGNPINTASGNKYQRETDYIGSGPFPLRFERHYNSDRATTTTNIGARWRHTYSREVRLSTDGAIAWVFSSDGRGRRYRLISGSWVADTGIVEPLTSVTGGGWKLVNKTDETEIYDAAGRLVSLANRAGIVQQIAYSSTGFSVTDVAGRKLTFTVEASSQRISAMTDPAGGQYYYNYDGAGNLASVTYPDNKTRAYVYENASFPNALTGIVDENGSRFATYGYDSVGRANLSEHAGGTQRVTVQYEDGWVTPRTSYVTDAFGNKVTKEFLLTYGVYKHLKTSGPCAVCGTTSETTYDSNGKVYYRYDFNRVRYRVVEDSRGLFTYSQNLGTGGALTTRTWHTTFRLPTAISVGDTRQSFTYDTSGNLTQKIEITSVPGSYQAYRTSNYTNTYSSSVTGLLAKVVVDGPRPDVADKTTYEYDAAGNLSKVVNALGHVTLIGDYDAHGRARSITDSNNVVTTLAYDARGRLTSRTVAGETTTYAYDDAGQLIRVTLPNGAYLAYAYDAAHRLTLIQDQMGNKIAYTLDAMGNQTRSDVSDPNNVLAQTHSRVYDVLGRLQNDIGGTNPSTDITQYTYDNLGNLLTITDPLNRKTTHTYNGASRLTKTVDPANGVVTYGYYNGYNDTVTDITDPRNLVTTSYPDYNYGGVYRPTITVSPDTGKTTVTYDQTNNVISRKDAKGQTTAYQYDALNRISKETRHDNTTVTYAYDSGTNGKGRLASVTDASGSTTWKYDAVGRVVQKDQVIGSNTFSTLYSYDTTGQLASVTYPSGKVIKYTWSNGRVTTVKLGGTPDVDIATGITYLPFGSVKSWTFGNGEAVTRGFDLDGRMTANSLGDISYDTAGRITGAYGNTYDYDLLDRLTSYSDGTNQVSYSYDATGNRTSQTIGSGTSTLAIGTTSNRIASVTSDNVTTAYSHDLNGSLTTDGVYTFVYNAAGRLVQAKDSGGAVKGSYVLNGLGQRVAKTASGVTTSFVYGESGQLLGEYNGTTAVQETVYLGNMPIATVRGSDIYYVHTDHLSTPRKVTDQNKNVRWFWYITSFGATAPNEKPTDTLAALTYNLRFPGQYYDAETGLHYNYYRDYDPKTGRYVESDPIGLKGGLATYNYANGNPLSFVDPTGEFGIYAVPIVAVIVVGAAIVDSSNVASSNNSSIPGLPPGLQETIKPKEPNFPSTRVAPEFPFKDPADCDKQWAKDIDSCRATCESVFSSILCRAKAKLKYYFCGKGIIGKGLGGMDDHLGF